MSAGPIYAMRDGYITAALWSSHDWDDMDEGDNPTPMDEKHDESDLAADAFADAWTDCSHFFDANYDRLLSVVSDAYPWDYVGHDFWLTRNGHGAGFWDRGLGRVGDLLSDDTKVYGEKGMYVDSGGLVHFE